MVTHYDFHSIYLCHICSILYKLFTPRIHTGWFVFPLPLLLFLSIYSPISPMFLMERLFMQTVPWIPSLGINFTTYMDGLSLVFGLLITGVGALVILYSIYYMSKTVKHYIISMFIYCYSWERCSVLFFLIIFSSFMYFGN